MAINTELIPEVINNYGIAPHSYTFGMFTHVLNLVCEPLWQGDIVGIHSSDEFTARELDAFIKPMGIALVIICEEPHSTVTGYVTPNYRPRRVARSIIKNKKLEVRE
jgi:hypothetical protein